MHSFNLVFGYTGLQPSLPLTSVIVVAVGAVLIFGRTALRLVTQWARPAAIWRTRGQGTGPNEFHPAVGEKTSPAPQREPRAFFLTTLWFGLVAGWLELGLVLARTAVNPYLSIDALRTNRHFVWMIPVSDALIFGIVGLLIALLATIRPGLARWTTLRLPLGLAVLTLLLTVEGLHAMAGVSLACGLALNIGPWLERRPAEFRRLCRVSLPVMAVSLVVLAGLAHERVKSAEHRALSCRPPAKAGAPNVLLIVLDDVRAASLSLYGYDRPTTPNLERLANKGVVFSEARATAPWTLPSHASMMTGRWPHELSVAPGLPLDRTFPTLAEALGKEGYATAGFVGNVYYCNALYGMDRGFARYEDAYENQTVSLFETVRSSGLGKRVIQGLGYPIRRDDGETSVRKSAAMVNRDVLGWLAGRPASEPFFVFINYYDAHIPYVLNGDPDQRFGLATLPLAEQAEIDKKYLNLAAGKLVPANVAPQQIENEGLNLYRDSYDSCIAYLDRQVGLLLDEIDRRGSLENTLVIVTSDHGEQFGEHGVFAHGASLYRQEVHVPLLVIPPSRSSAASIVSAPVSIRDIPATIAEWIDLGPRNPFPGRSLTQFLGDGNERGAETFPVLCEVQHIEGLPPTPQIPSSLGPLISLVSKDRVYIRSDSGREEIYDLVHDPQDAVNLAAYPESRPALDEFRAQLRRLNPDATTRRASVGAKVVLDSASQGLGVD
jgi:arylsulfatase A-like enzyme